MKLVVIYGPPASGKLTVAKILAERTGFKLLHNHLTFEMLRNVIEFGTQEFFDLNQKIKLDILDTMTKMDGQGVIYTFVYDRNTDNPFVARLTEMCDKNNAELLFVQIHCDTEKLFERVVQESRKHHKKIQSKQTLIDYLESKNVSLPIEGHESLVVDSTNLDEEQTTDKILELIA